MSRKTILLQIHKDLAAGEVRLPTLPEISLRIKKAASDPDVDIGKLGKIAETDPAFCGYLLQISNSPIYRGTANIENVGLAVGRLGLQNTRNIAMTYAVRALFSFNNKTIAKWLEYVWQNSTYTAAVASVIAEHIELPFDPDEAVLAGLLQDIGCLPLIDKAANYPELVEDTEAMAWLFDRYAASVGGAILRKWGLQKKFVEVTKNRDNWLYNDQDEVNLTDLILIAKFHTYLGQKIKNSPPRINRMPAFIKLHLEADLSAEDSLQFVADAKQKIAETRRALGG